MCFSICLLLGFWTWGVYWEIWELLSITLIINSSRHSSCNTFALGFDSIILTLLKWTKKCLSTGEYKGKKNNVIKKSWRKLCEEPSDSRNRQVECFSFPAVPSQYTSSEPYFTISAFLTTTAVLLWSVILCLLLSWA